MRLIGHLPAFVPCIVLLLATAPGRADTLELKDGTIFQDCYVKDEGIRLLVWRSLDKVGGPADVIPRGQVKTYKVERGPEWDEKPDLPDLSVTFIEMTPRLAGLHGRVQYDQLGRPSLGGCPAIKDLGPRIYTHPEEAVKDLELHYKPGEQITLTAHVKNLGFATAKPFDVVWLMDGRRVQSDHCSRSLKEMEETTFTYKWKWQNGQHHVTVRIVTDQREIATINNEATDPLWGWGYTFIVHKGRVDAWHQNRTAYGTFSFEDYYRWHVDIMNLLFENSIYPSAPNGIRARVRLDRIVYADDIEKAIASTVAEDGIRYDQGGWNWITDEDRNKDWKEPTHEWRNQTEWSLPHELGHQLGLVDYYAIDYEGKPDHVMPDTGEPVNHFQNHPKTMMHWHGPHLYNEVDAMYFNDTWDMPRGHFGDYYFALPRENYIEVVDVNGQGVPDATVEVYQRGVAVDPNGKPGSEFGVKYFPVIEDGNFGLPVSKDPVIVGKTNSKGVMRLPNRPVDEVKTLNGYQRKPNLFGNMNVVGGRGLLLVKVTKYDRPVYFWLEIPDFCIAYARGHRDEYTSVLKTPYGSVDSPPPPAGVSVEKMDENHVRVKWEAPKGVRDQHYLDQPLGFRVYRLIGNNGLNDRPWFPVATVGPDKRDVLVDLRDFPDDTYWFTRINRFAVSTIGELGIESELVQVVLPEQK